MAAAIQHAAGGAFLGAASSPAAADFTYRAVAAAAPRLLRLVQQHHASASAPRAIHTLLHRPSLTALRRPAASAATGAGASPRLFHSQVHRPVAGASKTVPAVMDSTAGSRHFSSNDKFKNQLQDEELKMKRKKKLAEALMNDLPTSDPGAKTHGAEINGIDHLLGLLDVADAATPTTNDAEQAARQVAELRSLVEKRKNALLIELLSDGGSREQRKVELVEAGRRLRDALVGHDERRALQNLYTEVKSLQLRVASAESSHKSLSDKVAAGRAGLESANAKVHSLSMDVTRLGYDMESARKKATAAQTRTESASTKMELLKESVARGRKEAEAAAAYGLALFVGGGTASIAAALTALHIF